MLSSRTLPSLTYGAQTWTLSRKVTQKIQTTQRHMEMYILGTKVKDEVKIQPITDKTKATYIAYTVKKIKFKLAGHLGKMKGLKKLIEWTPWHRNKKCGRPGRDGMTNLLKEQ